MAGTNLALAQQGGRHNLDTAALVTAVDWDRVGDMALSTHLHWLMLLLFDQGNERPMSGVVGRGATGSTHLQVGASPPLGFTVFAGYGMVFDPAAVVDEYTPTEYLPVVLDAPFAGTFAAHHPTLPRIDLVVAEPAWIDDDDAPRNVLGGATPSMPQRRRFGSTISVVTGTPAANPAAPATPVGAIALAEGHVPASSGNVVIHDVRPYLEIGPLLKAPPPVDFAEDFVPGTGTQLLVTETAGGPTMAVDVARGTAAIGGVRRFYAAQEVVVTAADPTDARIDLVVAERNGTLAVVAGTPAPVPGRPALTTAQLELAELLIPSGLASVVNAGIVDTRQRAPYVGALIQPASVNFDRMQTPTVYVQTTTISVVDDIATVPLQLTFPDRSTPLTGGTTALTFVAEIHEEGPQVSVAVGEFGVTANGPTSSLWEPPHPDIALAVSGSAVKLSDADMVIGGPLRFAVTDLAPGAASVEVRRRNGGVTGVFMLTIRPLGRPGGSLSQNVILFS